MALSRASGPEPQPRRASAARQEVPLPRSMAAIGDSITQGAGADPDGYSVAPQYSWTSGDTGGDIVRSHYERLLELEPRIRGNHHNLAIGGATMADGPRQARRAAKLGVDYVTILLGGNDLCAWSIRSVTSVSSFERSFRKTMDVLAQGLPDAHVLVLSVPNVMRLWEVLHDDPAAQQVWRMSGTCRSILSPRNSAADRELLRERNLAYNEVLERVCRDYDRCMFDDHAVYDHAYTPQYVSLDYFHPSAVGHRELAEISWRSGFWGDL